MVDNTAQSQQFATFYNSVADKPGQFDNMVTQKALSLQRITKTYDNLIKAIESENYRHQKRLAEYCESLNLLLNSEQSIPNNEDFSRIGMERVEAVRNAIEGVGTNSFNYGGIHKTVTVTHPELFPSNDLQESCFRTIYWRVIRACKNKVC